MLLDHAAERTSDTVEVLSGTPLGRAVEAGRTALREGDAAGARAAYRKALGLVQAEAEAAPGWAPDPAAAARLRRHLAVDLVGGLLRLGALLPAEDEALELLRDARRRGDAATRRELCHLLAEARVGRGDWGGAEAALGEAVRLAATLPAVPPAGRFLRCCALVAAHRGRSGEARRLLCDAWEAFAREGNPEGQRAVQRDLATLALDAGEAGAVDRVLRGDLPPGTRGRLLLARALRRDACPEAALGVLQDCVEVGVEPELRFAVTFELVTALRFLGEESAAAALLPSLREAAAWSGDEAAALATLRALGLEGGGDAPADHFAARLDTARRHAGGGDFQAAAALLGELEGEAAGCRRRAYWEFAAGELAAAPGLAAAEGREDGAAGAGEVAAARALAHLERAVELALEASVPELYVAALRLAGRVQTSLGGDLETALELWGRAERTDEIVASRQQSDRRRLRMREGSPTTPDEIIAAAAGLARREAKAGRVRAAACMVAALETARGRTVLSHLLPFAAEGLVSLPLPTDVEGCWRWLTEQARHLERERAVWFVHVAAERVYHAAFAPGWVHWASYEGGRVELYDAVEELAMAWRQGPEVLDASCTGRPGEMGRHLRHVAALLHLPRFLAALPPRVTRLSVVASGLLGEIPFAALPLDDGPGGEAGAPTLLVERFALSELPCLSALAPLRRRGRAGRGEPRSKLEVAPPGLAAEMRHAGRAGVETLSGAQATVEALAAVLEDRSFPLVQFDCHGHHDSGDAFRSWLELAEGGADDGRLTAQRLAELPLRRCGTLVLGACESGMERRLGRDEAVGLVRAGLAAGAAAVVAARWMAHDEPTVYLLHRFERYLRWLPRDRALQRSQRDYLALCRGGGLGPGSPGGRPLPEPDHPARWACWTLTGAPGYQTRAGRLRRRWRSWWWRLRGGADRWPEPAGTES